MKNKNIRLINTVRSDSSERLERLIKIARRALLNPRVSEALKKEIRNSMQDNSYASRR